MKPTEIEPPCILMIPQLYGKSEETGVFWLTCSFRYSTGTSLWKRNDCHYEILAKNTISVRRTRSLCLPQCQCYHHFLIKAKKKIFFKFGCIHLLKNNIID